MFGGSAMSLPIEILADEVLRLSTDERAQLLDKVVANLAEDRARDEAWDAVAVHRDAEIESGSAALISNRDLVARLRAELA